MDVSRFVLTAPIIVQYAIQPSQIKTQISLCYPSTIIPCYMVNYLLEQFCTVFLSIIFKTLQLSVLSEKLYSNP